MPALLTIVAALGTLCSIGYYVVCLWGAQSFQKKRAPPAKNSALPVSILKPICGTDPQAYENLRSHCVQDYPEFEIIFGVSEATDPAVPLIERLIREFPDRAIHLVVCAKVLGMNLKVSNLIQMLPLAKHDHLLINDSDIRVSPDYLWRVVRQFSDRCVGMVTCLYRGIAAGTLGSRLEALGISSEFIPGVLAAQQVEGGIHFALGSTLAFPRRALEAIGGLESLVNYLADDFELGQRIAQAGFDVVLADCVVEHYLPPYSFSGFLEHQLRWGRSTRNSRPWGYVGLVLTFGLPWALLEVVAARGSMWGWGLFSLALLFRLAAALRFGLSVLGDRQVLRDLWLIPMRDLLAVAIWVGGFTGRRVTWRGQEFVLKDRKLGHV